MTTTSEASKAVGWHIWSWDERSQRLSSWKKDERTGLANVVWPSRGELTATCAKGVHAAPEITCDCGIELCVGAGALIDRELVSTPNRVRGLVVGDGEVLEGPGLRRVERARLVAIGCYHRVAGCACEAAALEYGVDFYPRPHEQLLIRAKEEGLREPDGKGLWRSYQEVMPALERIVSLEYGSQSGDGRPSMSALLEIAAQAETDSSDSAALRKARLLSKEWWDAYTSYLLSMLVPYRQTEIASDFLWQLTDRFGLTAQGASKAEVEPMIYLLTLSGLAGQFSRHADVLFEWVRSCWRAGVAVANPS